MPWIAFVTGTAVVASAYLIWKMRYRAECPDCQSRKVSRLGREFYATRPVELMNGQDGGVVLQTIFVVRYRCSACQHEWSEREVD